MEGGDDWVAGEGEGEIADFQALARGSGQVAGRIQALRGGEFGRAAVSEGFQLYGIDADFSEDAGHPIAAAVVEFKMPMVHGHDPNGCAPRDCQRNDWRRR